MGTDATPALLIVVFYPHVCGICKPHATVNRISSRTLANARGVFWLLNRKPQRAPHARGVDTANQKAEITSPVTEGPVTQPSERII